jgi:hypothetical protein
MKNIYKFTDVNGNLIQEIKSDENCSPMVGKSTVTVDGQTYRVGKLAENVNYDKWERTYEILLLPLGYKI